MKSYNLNRIITFISISILIISISCSTSKIVAQEVKSDYMVFSIGEAGVEIRGTLKNYSKVKSLSFDSQPNISMVEENQKIRLTINSDGSMGVDDKLLPQSTIQSDGSFSFKFKNLSEGNYIFIIQPIKRAGHVSLVDLRTLKLLKLTISNSGPATNLIEIGQVNAGKP